MLRKDQTAILKQLYSYQLTIKDHHAPYLGDLIKDGYCYGFSLIRAAMRVTGKLKWWEDALDKILAWDGKADSLEQKCHLVDADKNAPATTLKNIFERVTHYIVFNQVVYPHARYHQYSFLRPGGLFMIVQKDNALYIKDHYLIAGHFKQNHIIQMLNNNIACEAIKNNICLIHNVDHTCELSYQDGKWNFFNPNYSDGKAKSFSTLKALAQEMTRVLGDNIAIELACTSKLKMNPFSYYDDVLLAKYPEALIQDQGWACISQHDMGLFTKIIKSLKNNDKLAYFNPRQTDEEGYTLLMEAAKQGDANVISALCKAGALPNQAGIEGWTPLMIAADGGHDKAILALCAAGATPNQAKPDGWTPLMSAANKGRIRAIIALCKAGALPNQAMPDGTTPLIIAAENDHAKTIAALCAAGALPNQTDKDGMTPLMFAAQFGRLGALNQLLHHQADPYKTSLVKLSCILAFAKKQGRQQAVKTLMKHQPPKWTALDIAVFFGHQKIVAALLDKMPNVDIKTLDKLYKLAQAINHTTIMEVLKQRKIKSASIKKAKEKPAKISNGPHSSKFFKATSDDNVKSQKHNHTPSPASTPKANAFQRA